MHLFFGLVLFVVTFFMGLVGAWVGSDFHKMKSGSIDFTYLWFIPVSIIAGGLSLLVVIPGMKHKDAWVRMLICGMKASVFTFIANYVVQLLVR